MKNLLNTFKQSAELRKQYFMLEKKNKHFEITTSMISYALNIEISFNILNLCKLIYSQGKKIPIPFLNTEFYNTFKAVYGASHNNSKIKTIACYILDNGKEESYVGKSIHVSYRIRTHLLGYQKSTQLLLPTLAKNKDAQLHLFVITKDIINSLEAINVSSQTFLTILEQYLILYIQPTINKLLIPVKGGSELQSYTVSKNYQQISILNPNKKPVFCYTVLPKNNCGYNNNKKTFELIYVMQSSTIFCKLFIKNKT